MALKNAAAHLIKLDSVNTARYYEALRDAKARKTVRKADQVCVRVWLVSRACNQILGSVNNMDPPQ